MFSTSLISEIIFQCD